MDLSHRLAISYYKTITAINEPHHVYIVQHPSSQRIFVKKILDVYNINVYDNLYRHPIPGTPRIIDYAEDDNRLLLIEEYVSGTPLSDRILSRSLTEKDVLSYTFDLCNILEKLHALNPPVIHRDIKPSNIIITNYNQVVLLDFNAAKQFSKADREDTILLGTQGYAAPEQYGFGASSPQTDIYSLGIVIQEMLSACTSRSEEWDAIIGKCTQLNPADRYASITELGNALNPLAKRLFGMHPAAEKPVSKAASGISRFLPPGFRTHTPWKMFVSSIVYLLVFWLGFSLKVKDAGMFKLWVERITCLLIMLSIIFGCFNYLNIQKLIPLCRHKNRFVRYLGIAILDFLIVIALFIIMYIVEH